MHIFSSFIITLSVLLLTRSMVQGFIHQRAISTRRQINRIMCRESEGNDVMEYQIYPTSYATPTDHIDSNQEVEGPDLFQRDAITTQDESVLVVAGPGAGKTRVLSARLAYLLETAICDPNEILVISFTNSAADRLRKKADEILIGSVATTKGVVSDTFHGFCLSVLRKYSHLIYNTQKKIVIIDDTDQMSIMLSLLEAKGYPPNQSSASNILRQIRYWKELGLGYLGIKKRNLQSWTEQRAYEMYPAYQTKLKTLAALDVGDLLLETLRLFRKFPQILHEYRSQFKHIIVDEFQDVSPAQYDILRMLVLGSRLGSSRSSASNSMDGIGSDSGVIHMNEKPFVSRSPSKEAYVDAKVSVFCAGDDDQSIYGWRGAQVELMRRFRFDFPGSKLLRFQTSYRMHDTLCKVSSAIASPLPGRIQKSLKSNVLLNIFDSDDTVSDKHDLSETANNKETRAGIEVRRMLNDEDEIAWIASYLQKKIATMNMSEKVKDNDFSIAILARAQHDLRRIMSALDEHKISYRSRGHGSATLPSIVMSPLNLLKLLVNPDDDVAFQSAIDNDIMLSAVTSYDVSSVILLQIKSLAMQKGISLFKSARQCILTGLLNGKYATALSRFIQKYDAWRSDFQRYYKRGDSGQKTIRHILYSAYSTRWSNEFSCAVDELSKSACGFDTLTNFFETIQLEGDYVVDQTSTSTSPMSNAAPRTNRITIWTMVMHAAKGLEFDEVLLPFWVDGNVPKSNSPDERRLAFVSLTRARERVMISYSQRKSNSMGKKSFTLKPSPYIDEIFDVNNSFITFEDVANVAADRSITSTIVASPSQNKEKIVKSFIGQSNHVHSTKTASGVSSHTPAKGKAVGTHPYLSEDLKKIITKQQKESPMDTSRDSPSASDANQVSTKTKDIGTSKAGGFLFPEASQLTSVEINRLLFESKANKTELKEYFKGVLASLYQIKRGLIEVTDGDGVVSTKQLSRATAVEIGRYLIVKMIANSKI